MQKVITESNPVGGSPEYDIFDVLLVLARRKKTIVLLPMVVGAITTAIVLLLPNVYQAGTKILPPQQSQSSASALLSQLGGIAGGITGAAALKNPNDLYIGMLQSRAVADGLIKRFDLMKHYQTDSAEKARRLLAQSTLINTGKDGLISIDVEDKDKKLVARLANGYVGELMNLTKTLAVTEAAQRRLFFERQLETAKDHLETAEVALKATIESRGVISVDSDSRAVVETVARLRAQISAKEIQLASLEAFVTENNQDYKRAREELNSLRAELSKLENGRPGTPENTTAQNSGLASVKALRDLKYYQMLYELLAKQYEVARLDEAKDGPIIQVLDLAIEPEQKFKPKRAVLVIVATILSLCAGIGWVLLVEFRDRLLREPRSGEKLQKLKTALRWY
jgi:uncharacterized protein involved in exopolysaccharide biosynthesis